MIKNIGTYWILFILPTNRLAQNLRPLNALATLDESALSKVQISGQSEERKAVQRCLNLFTSSSCKHDPFSSSFFLILREYRRAEDWNTTMEMRIYTEEELRAMKYGGLLKITKTRALKTTGKKLKVS